MEINTNGSAILAECLGRSEPAAASHLQSEMLNFVVDGVAVSASFSASSTQLAGVIGEAPRFGEAGWRLLLSKYLLQVQHDGGLLYIDGDRLQFSATIEEGEGVRHRMMEFFDAAVNWQTVVQALRRETDRVYGILP